MSPYLHRKVWVSIGNLGPAPPVISSGEVSHYCTKFMQLAMVLGPALTGGKNWSPRQELNLQPSHYECAALAVVLRGLSHSHHAISTARGWSLSYPG